MDLLDAFRATTEHTKKWVEQNFTKGENDYFIAESVNKFNKNLPLNALGYWSSGDEPVQHSSNIYWHSHPIRVYAGVTYKHLRGSGYGVATIIKKVDIDGKPLGNIDCIPSEDGTVLTFTATENCYVSINFTRNIADTVMFCEVDEYPEEYEPFWRELKDTSLEKFNEQAEAYFANINITPEQTSFVEKVQSANLLDPSLEYVSAYILGSGGSLVSGNYNTYFVPFKKSGIYSLLGNRGLYGDTLVLRVWFYDKDRNPIEYVTATQGGGGQYYSGNCTHIVINVPDELIKKGVCYLGYTARYPLSDLKLMIVEGEEYPPEGEYIPYENYMHIDGLKVDTPIDGVINPLYGKKISFNGDSICYGAGFSGGYGKIIAERNKMGYQNVARGGATIVSDTYSGDSARHWISRTISDMSADADYAIVEGGVNDASLSVPLGAISAGYNADLDDTTFYGAFESMLKQLTLRFAGKKIGYIAVHKMTNYFRSDNIEGTSYYWAAKKCCEKWGIPFCDLNVSVPPFAYFTSDNSELYALKTTYTKDGDGWHPTEEGYKKYYCDKIESWLRTL